MPREQLFGEHADAVDVEQRAVGVEENRFGDHGTELYSNRSTTLTSGSVMDLCVLDA
jgi:hypothetical protein